MIFRYILKSWNLFNLKMKRENWIQALWNKKIYLENLQTFYQDRFEKL